MAIRKGRSIEKSTKVKGGWYKASKEERKANPGKGMFQKNAQAIHMGRTGKYGSPEYAKTQATRSKKSIGTYGASVASTGAGYIASQHGHYKTGAALTTAGLVGMGASVYHSSKYEQGVNKATGTKRAAWSGFYPHPNQRNAKTGIRSNNPSEVRAGSRV